MNIFVEQNLRVCLGQDTYCAIALYKKLRFFPARLTREKPNTTESQFYTLGIFNNDRSI
jgi:hypothetical protein